MRRRRAQALIGAVLLVAGAILVFVGLFVYFGGASFMSQVPSSPQAPTSPDEKAAIVDMVIGVLVALVGGFILFSE